MERKSLDSITWQEVLTVGGMDADTASRLIGFVSWNKDEMAPLLGQDITNILSQSGGKAVVKDVSTSAYNDRGLLFLEEDVPDDSAHRMFDIIMDYEQQEVYGLH